MKIHLPLSLDINPGKLDIDLEDDRFSNKNRLTAFYFIIYHKNQPIFEQLLDAVALYLTGWDTFLVFKCILETEWFDAVSFFIQSEALMRVLISLPDKNLLGLLENMKSFAFKRADDLGIEIMVEDMILDLSIKAKVDQQKLIDNRELIFESILNHD